MTNKSHGVSIIELENDEQIKMIRKEIKLYSKQIGNLESMDTTQPYVASTLEFLRLMVKLRKEALDKLGLSYEAPHGHKVPRYESY